MASKINTEGQAFRDAVDMYEFAKAVEMMGDVRYNNDYANDIYREAYSKAVSTMLGIAHMDGVRYKDVLAAVREAVAQR